MEPPIRTIALIAVLVAVLAGVATAFFFAGAEPNRKTRLAAILLMSVIFGAIAAFFAMMAVLIFLSGGV